MNFEQRPHHDQAGHDCPACGNNSQEQWSSEDFIYGEGKDEVSLKAFVPKLHCEACGLVFTDERAEVIRHEAVCEHLRILPPKKIAEIREKHGFTQKEFAELSRIGRASLSRWETGDVTQNGSTDNLVYLLGFSDNVNRLQTRFKQEEVREERQERACVVRNRKFRCLSKEMIGILSKRPEFSLHPH